MNQPRLDTNAICAYVSGVIGLGPIFTLKEAAMIAGRSEAWLSRHLKKHSLPVFGQGRPSK